MNAQLVTREKREEVDEVRKSKDAMERLSASQPGLMDRSGEARPARVSALVPTFAGVKGPKGKLSSSLGRVQRESIKGNFESKSEAIQKHPSFYLN